MPQESVQILIYLLDSQRHKGMAIPCCPRPCHAKQRERVSQTMTFLNNLLDVSQIPSISGSADTVRKLHASKREDRRVRTLQQQQHDQEWLQQRWSDPFLLLCAAKTSDCQMKSTQGKEQEKSEPGSLSPADFHALGLW